MIHVGYSQDSLLIAFRGYVPRWLLAGDKTFFMHSLLVVLLCSGHALLTRRKYCRYYTSPLSRAYQQIILLDVIKISNVILNVVAISDLLMDLF